MRPFGLVGGVLVMLAATPVVAAELIVNGGFETGDFTGWTRSGALGNTAVTSAAANSGDYGASFSPNQVGSIAQTLATRAGQVYTISFDFAHNAVVATPANSFSFEFGGVTVQGYGDFGDYPYTRLTFTRVATGPSVLKFNFRDARASAFSLDNVSVTGPVPEPGSWALMIGGFGLAGAMLRRRRALRSA